MNRPLFVVCAAALLIAPWHVQAQSAPTETDISASEFRQVLLDVGSYLDGHKGTKLRSRFEALSDDAIQQLYSTIPNPHQLQIAVAGLKQHDTEAVGRLSSPPNPSAASPEA